MLDLPITFTAVLPQLTHDTDLGQVAVAGYAEMSGQSESEAVQAPPPYTASFAGEQLATLLAGSSDDGSTSMMLGADGLTPVGVGQI